MNGFELLETLTSVAGPSGYEDAVARVIAEQVADLGEVSYDPMGNLTLEVLGRNREVPSVMLVAHMDEVGLIVKYIGDEGLVYCDAIGLIDERTLLASKLDVWTPQGPVRGVVGVKGRHLLSPEEALASLTASDLWIDVGADTRQEANAMGIHIGAPVTFHTSLERLGSNRVVGKAIDNRAGCAVLINVAEEIAPTQRDRDFSIRFVFSAQEEIGARGAGVAANRVQPTIAIVIDTMPAQDVGTDPRKANSTVGGGPVIRVQDYRGGFGTIYSVSIRRALEATADKHGVKFQRDVFPTWTDGRTVHTAGGGIPTGGVFIPRLSSHSPSEIMDIQDMEATVRLLASFLDELDEAKVEALSVRPVDPPPTSIPEEEGQS